MASSSHSAVATSTHVTNKMKAAASAVSPTSVCTLDERTPNRWLPSPFGIPPHSWFLSSPQRCTATALWEAALSKGAPHSIPVLHTVHRDWCHSHDCSDPHFYHYAGGCSDLHVRVESDASLIVARNRLSAVVQLYARKLNASIDDAVAHVARIKALFGDYEETANRTRCGLNSTAYVDYWQSLAPCEMAPREARGEADHEEVVRARCVHEKRHGIAELNRHLLHLMFTQRVNTVVLLYAAPGGDIIRFAWKTEIVRNLPNAEEAFFDATGHKCDPWFRSGATCTFCTIRTPLASLACRGWVNPESAAILHGTSNRSGLDYIKSSG